MGEKQMNKYEERAKILEKIPSVCNIIIEGVDGAGKDYLIKQLLELYPHMKYEVVKCDRHTPNTFQFFKNLLVEKKCYIFNRFCYGQFVYQTSKDRKEKGWMTTDELLELEHIINETNSIVVYVKSDLNKCLHNCKKDRDDSYYTLDYLKQLAFKYEYFFSTVSQLDEKSLVFYNNEYELDMNDEGIETENKFNWKVENLPKIIAADFDECLVKGAEFPEIGQIDEKVRYELFEGRFKDYKKILWTSRTGQYLIDAITFCQNHGMYFDEYNRNIKEIREMTGEDTRKIYADIYLDDKALNDKDL